MKQYKSVEKSNKVVKIMFETRPGIGKTNVKMESRLKMAS